MKFVAFAGGVGGAKLAHGLAQILQAGDLTIVVNTGDDFVHLGLHISPDLDTVCYTLAGLANPATGWGRSGESWQALQNLIKLGGPGWFQVGDQDLGTHLERTRRLSQGDRLSAVTRDFCAAWGVQHPVLPMTDDPVATWVETVELGWLAFQEYFVHEKCQPTVNSFRFEGSETARPAPGVIEAVEGADWIIFCPSNPWVSIGPILSLAPLRSLLQFKPVVVVSPIVGGKALKGPAAKMYAELGIEPSALAVARHYQDLLSWGGQAGRSVSSSEARRVMVIDMIDLRYQSDIEEGGMQVSVMKTIMESVDDRRRFAAEILSMCSEADRRYASI